VNLVASAPIWLIALLAAALAAAAIEDAIRLRISNATCLAVLVAAIVAMALHGFPLALWRNLVVFVVLLVLGTLVFATGKVGGGDIKLLACLGLWVNLRAAPWLVASIFLAGGLIALVYLAVGIARRSRRRDHDDQRVGQTQIPYGLAIVAGSALVFAGQLGFMAPKYQQPDPYSLRVPG
jgi:prepilin peptidase CpaA